MSKFIWVGVAYAVWLGVKNWEQIQAIQEQVDQNERWLLDTLAAAGRHVSS